LGGVIGLGVDAISGAMYKLEPLAIDAQLNRTIAEPVGVEINAKEVVVK
jgi:hypothetical protein